MLPELLQKLGFDINKLPDVYRENNISIRRIGNDVVHLIIDYSDSYCIISFKLSKIYNIYMIEYSITEFRQGFGMSEEIFRYVTDNVDEIKQLIVIKDCYEDRNIYVNALQELERKNIPEVKTFDINELDEAYLRVDD